MKKFSDFICKHKFIIIIIAFLLLIPSLIGFVKTKVNYDILVYLPNDVETIKGENILADDFGMGSYSISVIENMNAKDVVKLENDIKKINGVEKVVSIYDVLGTTIPLEMLPTEVQSKLYKDNSTILFVTFTDSVSEDSTLEAVTELKALATKVNVGGMSAVILDTRDLSNSEVLIYILIAIGLCIIVLMLSLDNYVAPLILLLNIGIAVLYNMGTNIFLGEISYITKAISAVLQLGVTTDFSIFLYHKYRDSKKQFKTSDEAMSNAIRETMKSVLGSSLTTIAGFLALCTMTLTLGKDIGLVMAKGVLFGVICVLTIYPALLLVLDKKLEKFDHKPLIPKFTHLSKFLVKHYKIIFIIFLICLIPAYICQSKTEVYYNLDSSLPADLSSITANTELADRFNIVSPELILVSSKLDNETLKEMTDKLSKLDGMDFAISYADIKELGIPEEMLSSDLINMMKTDKYILVLTNSIYKPATNELNNQIDEVNNIVKGYDKNAIVAGEGALMKDLVEISDRDFQNVTVSSIVVVFIIMLFVLKSWSLPIILVCTIEFAIFINMGIPFMTDTTIPFIASIVIGTIQLGATIDYAILMTTKYLDDRKKGTEKTKAVLGALDNSVQSIFVSALCFFSATFGVGIYSKLEMIGSLCNMMARGSIISMLIVILVLPSMLLIFDNLIIKSTRGFKKEGDGLMKNKKKIIASVCAVMLLIPLNTNALSKNETVYVKYNNTGEETYYSVREHLINDEKFDEITLKTGLSDVANLNGNEKFSFENSNITIATNNGNDIFYEGKTNQKLPISFDIKYKLDGKEVNPNDIQGQKGKIEVTLNFKNEDKHGSVYTPFVVAVTSNLDGTNNRNIKVQNGIVTSNGTANLITAISTPGLYESLNIKELKDLNKIVISYDTENFEVSSYYMVITPKILDEVDLSIFDKTNSLYTKLDVLTENSTKLVSGTKELSSNMDALYGKLNEFNSKANALNGYTSAITTSYSEIDSYINSINEGLEKLNSATESINTLSTNINLINESYNKLTASTNNLNLLLTAFTTDYETHLEVLNKIMEETTDENTKEALAVEIENYKNNNNVKALYVLQDSIKELNANMTHLNTKVQELNAGSKDLSTNVNKLYTGSSALSVGSAKFKDSIGSFMDGYSQLANASNKIYAADGLLVNGAKTLNEGMNAFDKEGIQTVVKYVNSNVKGNISKVKELVKLSKNYSTYLDEEDSKIDTTSTIIILVDSKK